MHLLWHLFHFVAALLGARRWAQGGYRLPRYLHVVALCVTGVWAFCLWKLAPPRGYSGADVPMLLALLSLAPLAIYAIYIASGGDNSTDRAKASKTDAEEQNDVERSLRRR